jgi:hypothetical protein
VAGSLQLLVRELTTGQVVPTPEVDPVQPGPGP